MTWARVVNVWFKLEALRIFSAIRDLQNNKKIICLGGSTFHVVLIGLGNRAVRLNGAKIVNLGSEVTGSRAEALDQVGTREKTLAIGKLLLFCSRP
jgi:hypothetical protein